MTPFEAHYQRKPDLSLLQVFGSKVACKIPGLRKACLDKHVYDGIFLGYGATDKHIRYVDVYTNKEKLSLHAVFDEAYYSSSC